MKRTFDICLSLFGILLVAPFLLPVMLLVVLESKGGAFYKQLRVGRFNRDFYLYKIRTMYVGADKQGQLTIGKRDRRVTRMGGFLRKFKLDEFPQLLNILMGDMSFVGPRPEVRKYVDMYNDQQLKVLNVRPGLTDMASLRYYNESEELAKYEDPEKAYIEIVMPSKLAMNLEYIEKSSFLFDLKLIFRTLMKWVK